MSKPDLGKKKETSALDASNLSEGAQDRLSQAESFQATPGAVANFYGFANRGRANFDAPKYLAAGAEAVYSKGNSSIVLGLDRPGNKLSGFGGAGNTHCAAIDIVAGRLGAYATSKTSAGEDVLVNPNFKLDAARIYISQKSDVDGNFDIAPGTVGSTQEDSPRSTVAVKADTVRIIGRENIKLVTRTDRRNSQGGETDNTFKGQYGIDLIAMNDDKDMQSLVKGENLVGCLNAIVDSIVSLRTMFENLTEYNRNMVIAVMTHTHTSPFFGIDSAPDYKQIIPEAVDYIVNSILNVEVPCMLQHMMETNSIVNDYLSNEGGMVSPKYICSKYNHTN